MTLSIAITVTSWMLFRLTTLKGGGSHLNILKTIFQAMSWRWWQGHEPTFLGRFLVHAPINAHVRPRSYLHHSIFLDELIILMWSNVKIGWKSSHLQKLCEHDFEITRNSKRPKRRPTFKSGFEAPNPSARACGHAHFPAKKEPKN